VTSAAPAGQGPRFGAETPRRRRERGAGFGTWRLALVVAGKDLRQRVRDRSAIVQAIVAPLAISLIVSAALGGSTNSFHAHMVVVDLDHGPVAQAFVGGVVGAPQLRNSLTITDAPDVGTARSLIRRNRVAAAFVLPAGMSAAVQAGATATVEVIHNGTDLIAGQIADALADTFRDRTNGVVLAVRTALTTGAVAPADVAAFAARAAAAAPAITLDDPALRGGTIKPGAFFGPSMAVFFLFGTLSNGIRTLLVERRSGTLSRLLAAPAPRDAIVIGKALATFTTGLVSMAVLVVASQVLLGASWGDPVAVALVSLAVVVAMMGLAALVALLAKTEEQAGTLGSIFGIVFAIAGGNFAPASSGGGLHFVSRLTPNGWALDAFTRLGAGDGTAAIARNLAVLGAMGLAGGALATRRARRMVLA